MSSADSERLRRYRAYLDRGDLCRGGRVRPHWAADNHLVFEKGGSWFQVDLPTGTLAPARPPATGTTASTWLRGGFIGPMPVPEVPSPDGRWFASIRDCNIVLRSMRDGQIRAITTDGRDELSWDIETERYRMLPGLETGRVFTSPWRPDGGALLAFQRDISGVFQIPRIHWLNDFEQVDFTPFEKAGARIDRYQPYLVDIRRGPIRVDVGEVEDRYVHLLGWHPRGHEVFLVVYSRDLREARIVAANGHTGSAREVTSERGASFLRLQHDTLMSGAHGFAFLPDGGFLWLSARDGWAHIYHYRNDGELVGQLTRGNWPVYDIHTVDGSFVYFTAACDESRPYDVHVCRVPLEGGAIERLTNEPGIHDPQFAPDVSCFIDTHSRFDRPTASDLRRADGTIVIRLDEMDISQLEAHGYRPPEEFCVKAADGQTDLWGILYTPADFNPAQRYPVVEHIYGGPQIIAAPRQFSAFGRLARNFPWALAQLGYVVVILDARGTPGRSKAFQDVVHGGWGDHVMADHAAAIRQLCDRHAWMDINRVGIAGHSWGGYFSTAALVEEPDLYKVAVSSSPGYIPWESILYEPYLGLPSENRAAYDHADLTRRAAQLKGDLLLIAGTSEYGPISDAMKMSRALIDAGVQHEFAVLPGEHHSYVGKAERYFTDKASAFFERHLKHGVPQ